MTLLELCALYHVAAPDWMLSCVIFFSGPLHPDGLSQQNPKMRIETSMQGYRVSNQGNCPRPFG